MVLMGSHKPGKSGFVCEQVAVAFCSATGAAWATGPAQGASTQVLASAAKARKRRYVVMVLTPADRLSTWVPGWQASTGNNTACGSYGTVLPMPFGYSCAANT